MELRRHCHCSMRLCGSTSGDSRDAAPVYASLVDLEAARRQHWNQLGYTRDQHTYRLLLLLNHATNRLRIKHCQVSQQLDHRQQWHPPKSPRLNAPGRVARKDRPLQSQKHRSRHWSTIYNLRVRRLACICIKEPHLTHLTVTERARKLRAQYAFQAQGLRARLELRINRIPQSLRKTTMQDLVDKYTQQNKPSSSPQKLHHISHMISSPAKNRGIKRSRYATAKLLLCSGPT